MEQITQQTAARDADERKQIEIDLQEVKEKLERKEFFMQSKEKKWLEIETVLAEYIAEDDELRDRF